MAKLQIGLIYPEVSGVSNFAHSRTSGLVTGTVEGNGKSVFLVLSKKAFGNSWNYMKIYYIRTCLNSVSSNLNILGLGMVINSMLFFHLKVQCALDPLQSNSLVNLSPHRPLKIVPKLNTSIRDKIHKNRLSRVVSRCPCLPESNQLIAQHHQLKTQFSYWLDLELERFSLLSLRNINKIQSANKSR